MDADDDIGSLLISIDESSCKGLGSAVKQHLEQRVPLQRVPLLNKLGRNTLIDRLSVQFILSNDKRLLRLKPFAQSPVCWFRIPYAHLILISTGDPAEYRNTLRPAVKRSIGDMEREWGQAEWVVCFVRPPSLDPQDKNVKKVLDRVIEDFAAGGRRERVIRLDLSPEDPPHITPHTPPHPPSPSPPPGQGFLPSTAPSSPAPSLPQGLDEVEGSLRECVRVSFHARQSAYVDESRRLLNQRLAPDWSFPTLYLVMDSFAQLLEGVGLHEDALNELTELEACYLETLSRLNASDASSSSFGGSNEGDDSSPLLSQWRQARKMVMSKKGAPEFKMRQFLFAAQARLLIKLGRQLDVLERGLAFITLMKSILIEKEDKGIIRPLLKEVWTLSACLSLSSSIPASLFMAARPGGEGEGPGAAEVYGEWDFGLPKEWGDPQNPELRSLVSSPPREEGPTVLAQVAGASGTTVPIRQQIQVQTEARAKRLVTIRAYHLRLGHLTLLALRQLAEIQLQLHMGSFGGDRSDLVHFFKHSKMAGMFSGGGEGARFESTPVQHQSSQQQVLIEMGVGDPAMSLLPLAFSPEGSMQQQEGSSNNRGGEDSGSIRGQHRRTDSATKFGPSTIALHSPSPQPFLHGDLTAAPRVLAGGGGGGGWGSGGGAVGVGGMGVRSGLPPRPSLLAPPSTSTGGASGMGMSGGGAGPASSTSTPRGLPWPLGGLGGLGGGPDSPSGLASSIHSAASTPGGGGGGGAKRSHQRTSSNLVSIADHPFQPSQPLAHGSSTSTFFSHQKNPSGDSAMDPMELAASYLMGSEVGGKRVGGSQPSTPIVPSAFPPPVNLPWLTEWRLRMALGTDRVQSFALALATTTATLYSLAGRRRSACLLLADVATMLMGGKGAGSPSSNPSLERLLTALSLLEIITTASHTESWDSVLRVFLPLLIDCHVKLLASPSSSSSSSSPAARLSPSHLFQCKKDLCKYSFIYLGLMPNSHSHDSSNERLQTMKLIDSHASALAPSSNIDIGEDSISTTNAIQAKCHSNDISRIKAGESAPLRVVIKSNLPSSVKLSGLSLILKTSHQQEPRGIQRVNSSSPTAESLDDRGERELRCSLLLLVEQIDLGRDTSDARGSADGLKWIPALSASHGSVEGCLELLPGLMTRLTFLASPYLSGSYSASRIECCMGCLDLDIPFSSSLSSSTPPLAASTSRSFSEAGRYILHASEASYDRSSSLDNALVVKGVLACEGEGDRRGGLLQGEEAWLGILLSSSGRVSRINHGLVAMHLDATATHQSMMLGAEKEPVVLGALLGGLASHPPPPSSREQARQVAVVPFPLPTNDPKSPRGQAIPSWTPLTPHQSLPLDKGTGLPCIVWVPFTPPVHTWEDKLGLDHVRGEVVRVSGYEEKNPRGGGSGRNSNSNPPLGRGLSSKTSLISPRGQDPADKSLVDSNPTDPTIPTPLTPTRGRGPPSLLGSTNPHPVTPPSPSTLRGMRRRQHLRLEVGSGGGGVDFQPHTFSNLPRQAASSTSEAQNPSSNNHPVAVEGGGVGVLGNPILPGPAARGHVVEIEVKVGIEIEVTPLLPSLDPLSQGCYSFKTLSSTISLAALPSFSSIVQASLLGPPQPLASIDPDHETKVMLSIRLKYEGLRPIVLQKVEMILPPQPSFSEGKGGKCEVRILEALGGLKGLGSSGGEGEGVTMYPGSGIGLGWILGRRGRVVISSDPPQPPRAAPLHPPQPSMRLDFGSEAINPGNSQPSFFADEVKEGPRGMAQGLIPGLPTHLCLLKLSYLPLLDGESKDGPRLSFVDPCNGGEGEANETDLRSIPPPPRPPSHAPPSLLTFEHLFELSFPPEADPMPSSNLAGEIEGSRNHEGRRRGRGAAGPSIQVHFIGPRVQLTLHQPVSLQWHLVRMKPSLGTPEGKEGEVIKYEITSPEGPQREGPSWSINQWGHVRLGRQVGSVAVVEVRAVPVERGTLAIPRLTLGLSSAEDEYATILVQCL